MMTSNNILCSPVGANVSAPAGFHHTLRGRYIAPTADYAVSKLQVDDKRSQSSVLAGLIIGPSYVTLSRSEGSVTLSRSEGSVTLGHAQLQILNSIIASHKTSNRKERSWSSHLSAIRKDSKSNSSMPTG